MSTAEQSIVQMLTDLGFAECGEKQWQHPAGLTFSGGPFVSTGDARRDSYILAVDRWWTPIPCDEIPGVQQWLREHVHPVAERWCRRQHERHCVDVCDGFTYCSTCLPNAQSGGGVTVRSVDAPDLAGLWVRQELEWITEHTPTETRRLRHGLTAIYVRREVIW